MQTYIIDYTLRQLIADSCSYDTIHMHV